MSRGGSRAALVAVCVTARPDFASRHRTGARGSICVARVWRIAHNAGMDRPSAGGRDGIPAPRLRNVCGAGSFPAPQAKGQSDF